jgi:integrase
MSPIDTATYSIRWAHSLAGLASPTDESFVKSVLEGCRRIHAKAKSPKEPISSEDLAKLVADKGGNDASISDIRLLFICLVAFAGMLSSDEIISLKVRDVVFLHDHMAIRLPKRKNDQFRQGHTVYIARTGNPTCPVAMAERYIRMLGIVNSPSHPIVCGLRHSKCDGLKPTSRAISYSTVRDLIKQGLSPYVSDPSVLGTHSLRAGGASEAASSNVNERCITRQGGWKSKSSKDLYIKDSIDNKLAVTRAMKL